MKDKHIHIIGGGAIGLCTAFYLQQLGYQITIIDKSSFKEGASYGNAGMIVPSHFVPLAAPGVIWQGLKWLLNSNSPFYIRPRFDRELWMWLWQFYASCTTRHLKHAMPLLHALNEWSAELFDQIASEESFHFDLEKKGLLMLFNSKKQEQKERKLLQMAHKLGVAAELLNQKEAQELNAGLEMNIRAAVYFPEDAHFKPSLFMNQMKALLKAKGVQFLNEEIVDILIENRKPKVLKTKKKEMIDTNGVIVSAGAWSARLLKKMGFSLLLQDGKGYSITINSKHPSPKIPSILTEGKIAITPFAKQMRISGTLELSGLSKKINTQKVKAIIQGVSTYYPEIAVQDFPLENAWYGFRPCSPDGLPYLGQFAGIDNLIVACGHGMMGMSMAPVTGKLVSLLVDKQSLPIDIRLLRLDRFNKN